MVDAENGKSPYLEIHVETNDRYRFELATDSTPLPIKIELAKYADSPGM